MCPHCTSLSPTARIARTTPCPRPPAQWFGQFLIKHGDQTVLDVAADQENLGHMKIIMDGKEVDPMPGEMTYTSESHKRVST